MSRRHVRDKEAKIRLIFETFAELVNRDGYDKLSTRHIADAAGISVGTIYNYFPGGKHAIASRYIDQVTDELFDPGMFMGLGEGDLRRFLDGLIRRYLDVHRENLEIHRAIDQAILADSGVYRRNRETTLENMGRVVKELREKELYSTLPETSVLRGFILFFNVLEALVHRHLFIFPLYEADEGLVAFLVGLLEHVIVESGAFDMKKSAGGGI